MTVRKKKYRLYRRMKANGLAIPRGFKWKTGRIGKPCEQALRVYQRFVGVPVTGKFDKRTMDALFPSRFRRRIVAVAKQEIGVHESSQNWGERVADYLRAVGIAFPTSWCAAFVVFVIKKAGYAGSLPPKPAWVPSWSEWAARFGLTVGKAQARLGDIVCLNWPGTDSTPDHIAIVTGNLGALKRLTTIGGNEGDAVREGWRPYWHVHTVIRLRQYARR